MHPLLTAWLTYSARMDEQPNYEHSRILWRFWLEDCIALASWWDTLRRLPEHRMA